MAVGFSCKTTVLFFNFTSQAAGQNTNPFLRDEYTRRVSVAVGFSCKTTVLFFNFTRVKASRNIKCRHFFTTSILVENG